MTPLENIAYLSSSFNPSSRPTKHVFCHFQSLICLDIEVLLSVPNIFRHVFKRSDRIKPLRFQPGDKALSNSVRRSTTLFQKDLAWDGLPLHLEQMCMVPKG